MNMFLYTVAEAFLNLVPKLVGVCLNWNAGKRKSRLEGSHGLSHSIVTVVLGAVGGWVVLWGVVSVKIVVEGGEVISAKKGGRVVGTDEVSAAVGFGEEGGKVVVSAIVVDCRVMGTIEVSAVVGFEEEGGKVVVSAIVVDFRVVGDGVVFANVVVVVAGHVLTSWVVDSSGEVVVGTGIVGVGLGGNLSVVLTCLTSYVPESDTMIPLLWEVFQNSCSLNNSWTIFLVISFLCGAVALRTAWA